MIDKILKGTVAVFSNSLLTSILALSLVPLILSAYGPEKYGLIVLTVFLSVRNGILGIFIFGVQSAIIKFVAEYNAKEDYSKVSKLLGTSFLFYVTVSTLVVIILAVSKRWLFGSFFNLPPLLVEGYLDAFNYVLASIFFQFFSLIFLGYFEGLHQFFISKVIDSLSYLAYFLCVLLCLFFGFGYVEIVKLLGLMHVFTFLLCLIFFRLQKGRCVPSFSFDKTLQVGWLRFCIALFSNSIAAIAYQHSPKLLITTLLSPSALAIYDIVSKVPATVKSIIGLGNRVIVPTASELLVKIGVDANTQLFTLGLKINLLVFVPFVTALIVLSENLLLIWVGSEYVEFAYLMQMLFWVPLLSIFMSFGFAIFLGENYRLRIIPIFGWSILILSLLYWYFLIESDGLYGIVAGRVFGLAVTAPIAMCLFFKHFKVAYVNFTLRIVALASLAFVPVLLKNIGFTLFRFESILTFLLLFSVLYFSYAGAIYLTVLDRIERALVANTLIRIRSNLVARIRR